MASSGKGAEIAGWVEPFAKPIIFVADKVMGIASLHPFYGAVGSWVRQIGPTGKSVLFYGIRVKPKK